MGGLPLSALTSIHKGVKKHASKDQTLLIALIGNDLVLSTPGLTVSETASGEWGGVGSVKLAHMLSFLTAEPEGDPVMIVRIDEAIRIGSARIPARWADLSEAESKNSLKQHASRPMPGLAIKYKCVKCKAKQGVSIESIETGPLAPDVSQHLAKNAEHMDHGFGCLACGYTWAEQVM